MRVGVLSAAALLAGWVGWSLAQAQETRIRASGGEEPTERSTVRVFYWDSATQTSPGQVAVNYGAPEWKDDYSDPADFDSMTCGETWRMGKDFWTLLDTNLPLQMGSHTVPVGAYYLGVQRSQDGGQWDLLLIDPAEVRRAHLDAVQIKQAPVAYRVPLTLEHSEAMHEKMGIALLRHDRDISKLTFRLQWGHLTLSAPIQVGLDQPT